ncbi:hypothetical protein FB451DRAFT_1387736 [Mycena latifolia]|nr:hypothetical protein FB451DRAFT_1387736 [Mycena latifolia]
MSVKELQGRINKLSANIIRQKEMLKNLERDKFGTLAEPDVRHAPLLLLQICNAWTDIAVSTPALWTIIEADYSKFDLPSLLDVWFKRARSRALDISLPTADTSPSTLRQSLHDMTCTPASSPVDAP